MVFSSSEVKCMDGIMNIKYDSDAKNVSGEENITFVKGEAYSFSTVFGSSLFDFSGLEGENNYLNFTSVFGSADISNIEAFDAADFSNVFGSTEINTGIIKGDTFINVNNVFGSTTITLQPGVEYLIETSSVFGSANNELGSKSSGYDASLNRVHVSASSVFGEINILRSSS